MTSVEKSVVLVTGGGYGIGRQIALGFARLGADVVVAARSVDRLKAVADEIVAAGGSALPLAMDVTKTEEVDAVFATIEKKFGRLDVLVNNSGIAGPTALAKDVTLEQWRQCIDVNLTGAFYCAKHASRMMIAKKAGNIINISSIAGRLGYGERSPYSASKWGLIGFSHSLAAELGPHNIRVNAVLPGLIEGDRFDGVMEKRAALEGGTKDEVFDRMVVKQTPLGRLIKEREVADTVLYLASKAASGITGQALNVCGGFRMQ